MTEEEIFFAKGDNPKMNKAFKDAQDTFKYFWRELSWEYRRIIPALNVACVKVAFTQEKENRQEPIVEHMWINDVEFDGNNVKGVLINSPNELTNVANGDIVDIPFNQISDWLFAITEQKAKGILSKLFSAAPKIKTYGGFTIQAMRSEMTNQERKQHDSAWGLDFGDYNEVLIVNEQKGNPENLIEHPMSKNMREKLVEFLNENPNAIKNFDEKGYSLLHKEAIAGNLTSVKVLIEAGSDKNIKTNQGETALDFAKKLNWAHIIPILDH
jgi:uncharacterized protein YegJ (DUF2314 family)